MNLNLHGRVALVTGSTAGIGYAIAETLAQEGAEVVVNGRSPERVEQACARIRAAVPAAVVRGCAADLATAAGVAALVADCPQVEILVNNLGIFEPKAFADISDVDWQHMFEVNVMSGVRLARAYLPAMRAANWGRIVFISSESGANTPGEMVHYGMSKTAQIAVARGLAESVAGSGITVNSVLPGPTRTEGAVAFFTALAAEQGVSLDEAERRFFAEARPSSLIKRFINPTEVASLVAYVCSPLASATTGAALRAEGGVVRSIL